MEFWRWKMEDWSRICGNKDQGREKVEKDGNNDDREKEEVVDKIGEVRGK